MKRAFLAAMLIAGSALAGLPPLRSEQPVSPVTYRPSLYANGFSRAASDGTNFLNVAMTSGAIYATRITPAGEQLDSPSITIARIDGSVSYPGLDVIYAGGQYVIAYTTPKSVVTATLTREGRPIVNMQNVVADKASADRAYFNLKLAWNGRNLLLLMGSSRVRLLDVNGAPVAPEQTLPLVNPTGGDVASNGDGFLVAAGGKKAWCLNVDSEGRVGAPRVVSDMETHRTAVASDGRDYLVVTCVGPAPGAYRFIVRGDSLSEAMPVSGLFGVIEADALWTGSQYVVVFWLRGVVVQTFRSDGSLKDSSVFYDYATAPLNFVHDLKTNGTQCLIVGVFNDRYDPTSRGYIFDPDRHPTTQFSTMVGLINRAPDQRAPAVATNGSDALLVWTEETGLRDGEAIRGVRIAADGTLGAPFEIATGVFYRTPPAVASNGQDFLVAWQDQTTNDIYTRRVTGEGTLQHIRALRPGTGGNWTGSLIAAAWSGRTYIVVWTGNGAVYSGASDGNAVTNAPPAISSIDYPNQLAIACSVTSCIAASRASFIFDDSVYSRRFSPDGSPLNQHKTRLDGSSKYVLLPRDNDVLLLYPHSSDLQVSAVSLATGMEAPFGGVTDSRPVAVVGNGVYLINTTPYPSVQVRWTRVQAVTGLPIGPIVDVDAFGPYFEAYSPLVITETSGAVCLVHAYIDDTGSSRLFVRTYARSGLPQPAEPERRRAAH